MAPVQLRYRVVHHPHCQCKLRMDYQFDMLYQVMAYLWGRKAPLHTIYVGSRAYIFTTNNLDWIHHFLAQEEEV